MTDTAIVPLTIHMPAARRDALDALARTLDTDSGQLANEPVARFIEAQEGWAAHLRAGLREAGAGDIATPEEVAEAFARPPGR